MVRSLSLSRPASSPKGIAVARRAGSVWEGIAGGGTPASFIGVSGIVTSGSMAPHGDTEVGDQLIVISAYDTSGGTSTVPTKNGELDWDLVIDIKRSGQWMGHRIFTKPYESDDTSISLSGDFERSHVLTFSPSEVRLVDSLEDNSAPFTLSGARGSGELFVATAYSSWPTSGDSYTVSSSGWEDADKDYRLASWYAPEEEIDDITFNTSQGTKHMTSALLALS